MTLNVTIDSLNNKKLIVKQNENKFTVSSSISNSANLLKQNLNEKNINTST
jgi:hypothetical protein